MKIYLASSFNLKDRVQKVAEILRESGHEITVEWWHKDYKQLPIEDDEEWYAHPKVKEISERNFNGIRECDIFLLVAHPTNPKSFNGANIELGFAHALGKPCLSIGKLQRSAMYCPINRKQMLNEIKRLSDFV